jgi:hypothetical protein
VDFVLTSTFRELEARFAGRALNLMLNDDGEGGHRIVVMGGSGSADAASTPPPTGWVPYNPAAATRLLDEARRELLNCFFARDSQGVLTNLNALNEQNGKLKEQFQFDLRVLSKLGARLFSTVTSAVNVEGARSEPVAWSKALRKKLKSSAVVQVARSVRAEYAFPWALIYDVPMPGPDFEFCPVIKEWGKDGVRLNTMEHTVCPYADQDFHLENIYCPFGFWGLKHIVEQPPSVLTKKNDAWVLREVVLEISAPKDVRIAVGTTRDPQLDARQINGHLTALKGITALQFSAQSPAEDVETVRSALESPEIVYLLCHGQFNPSNNEFYLGIGDPDDKNHQVYPHTVHGWADSEKSPNLSEWLTLHPLVFINGCHTADLKPEQTLQFVSEFNYAQASGILGTEVSIQLSLATEVAQHLLTDIAAGTKLGEALRSLRWQLANKGNLLGLAYTLYAMADLRVVRTSN